LDTVTRHDPRHYTHIGLDSAKKAISALPQGNQLLDKTSDKTDNQKMDSEKALVVFQGKKIRRTWFNDEWWF
jgi:hypothetical protein